MGKNLSHKKVQYIYSKKRFTRRAKPIRIISVRMGGVLLCFEFKETSNFWRTPLLKLDNN
jgi:hypothetical protein